MDERQIMQMIAYCRALDPRIGRRDDQETAIMVRAWHDQLPIDLTADDAKRIVNELHREGRYLTPGAIGMRYDELHTPRDQQGIRRSPRPVDAPRQKVIGSGATAVMQIEGGEMPAEERSQLLTDLKLRHPSLRVECPYCGAKVGRRCHDGNGHILTRSPAHPSRLQAVPA